MYGGQYPMGQQGFNASQQGGHHGGYQGGHHGGQQGFPGGQHQHQFAMQHQQNQQLMGVHQQQRAQCYQHYQQQSQHYGQYGQFYTKNVFSVNASQAFQFQSPNDLQAVFHAEMSKNPENAMRNAIQAEDLMNVLNNTPSIRSYFNIQWSREMCSIMLAMLDRSTDGFMQYEEFTELQQCLIAWHNVFRQHDTNRSGFMEANEINGVIQQLFGFKVHQKTLTTLLKRYSRVVAPARCLLAFDDFVALCVRLRAYTDAFRKRDGLEHGCETGACQFSYDDFLQCVMCL